MTEVSVEKPNPGVDAQVKAEAQAAPVLEGAEDLVRDLADEERNLRCFVRHEDAGGKCGRKAVVKVYGLNFCELHGAEVRIGALNDLYEESREFFYRLDNVHTERPHPAVLAVIWDAADRFLEAQKKDSEAIRRAYPVIRERVEEDTLDFDYEDPDRGFGPVDWHTDTRRLIHKLMRQAYEERATWLVEGLELDREHVTAQLSFALADYEERVGTPTA